MRLKNRTTRNAVMASPSTLAAAFAQSGASVSVRCRAYRRSPMLEATWKLRPCDPQEAAGLARALEVSETTASVLLRRGYLVPRR